MSVDQSTTKYEIKARLTAEGVVEKPDVVGAIFGQTEGLLGDELDLRDLQKTQRIGRIEVEVDSKKGRSEGTIMMPSSLDQVETAILAAALETIDRIGPCKAEIKVLNIEDVRVSKKQKIVERAKALLKSLVEGNKDVSADITESVRASVQVEEVVSFGPDKCPAGPNVAQSDAIIIVEGRSDVINLLKYGIKNTIAVEGTNVPKTIQELSKEKSVTVFLDGDRGGDLILKELLQVAEIDFIARAPRNREVEELTQKQIMKALRNKMSTDQYTEMFGFKQGSNGNGGGSGGQQPPMGGRDRDRMDRDRPQRRDDREPGGGDRFRPRDREMSQPVTTPPPAAPTRTTPLAPSVIPPPPSFETTPEPSQDLTPDATATGAFATDGSDRTAGGFGEQKKTGFLASLGWGRKDKPGKLSEAQLGYKKMLTDLSGSFKANLLDTTGKVLSEIPVRDLAETLKNPPAGLHTVVFDGVVSQRILDIASDKDIKVLVGVKLGNITKQPTKIEVYTKADLE